MKHAPESKMVAAKWGYQGFEWMDGDKAMTENCNLPAPVKVWWKNHHPNVDIEKLAIISNDKMNSSPKMFGMLLHSMMGGKPEDLIANYVLIHVFEYCHI